jgi:hypothetical protein
MTNPRNLCRTCQRGVKQVDDSVRCSNCDFPYHAKCLPIYQIADIDYAKQSDKFWTCPFCWKEIFPLNLLENEEMANFLKATDYNNIDHLNELLFDPYELNGERRVFEDIDPDDNCLNVLASQTIYKCKYYLPENLKIELEKTKTPTNLSLFHLNIRSTKKKQP